MGLFGNADRRAQRRADRRAARTERVATRREFLSSVIDKGAGIASMFAPNGANEEGAELSKAMQGGEGEGTGTGTGTTTADKPGMPKWVIPAAVAGVLLFVFMNKKGRR